MAITKLGTSGVYNLVKYLDMLADNTEFGTYWFNIIPPATGTTVSLGDIDTDSSNNIYVGASYTSSGSTSQGLYKIQPNALVSTFYTNKITSINNSGLTNVALDSSNNIYLGGQRDGTQGAMAKLNSSGVNQWQKRTGQNSVTFQYTQHDVSPSGNIFEVHIDNGRTLSYTEVGFLAINPDGTERWGSQKPMALNEYFYANDVVAMSDTRMALSLTYNTPQRGSVWCVQGTSTPSFVWGTDVYNTGAGSNRNTQIYKLASDSSNNVFGAGYWMDDSSGGVINALLCKFNSSGTLLWSRRLYNTTSSKFAENRDVSLDSSGNIYTVGYYTDASSVSNTLITKYNTSGVIQWQRFIKMYDSDAAAYGSFSGNNIKIDSSGDIVLRGNFYPSASNTPGYGSLVVFRLPSSGSFTGTVPFTFLGKNYRYESINGTGTEGSITPTTETKSSLYGNSNGSPQSDTGTGGTGVIGNYKAKVLG